MGFTSNCNRLQARRASLSPISAKYGLKASLKSQHSFGIYRIQEKICRVLLPSQLLVILSIFGRTKLAWRFVKSHLRPAASTTSPHPCHLFFLAQVFSAATNNWCRKPYFFLQFLIGLYPPSKGPIITTSASAKVWQPQHKEFPIVPATQSRSHGRLRFWQKFPTTAL